METFTGKKPTDEIFNEEMSLKQWVENSFPDAITEVIDANLLRTEEDHYTIKKDCLSSVIRLALACSATSPQDRINMKDTVVTLQNIKRNYLTQISRTW